MNLKYQETIFGLLPKTWSLVKFKDILKLKNEKSTDNLIQMYSITNNGIFPRDEKFNKQLSGKNSKYKLIHKNNLIFGMSREILNWGIMKEKVGGVSSAYTVYEVDSSINIKYLEYFIGNWEIYFKDIIKPASREGQGIEKDILMTKVMYVPPKEDLTKMFEIIDSINKKIEINTKINNNLEQLSGRIFKEWFLLYNFPNSKNLPYKNNKGLFKNTKIGEIPEKWDVIKIGDLNLLITDYVANGSFASLKENVTILDDEDYAYFIRNTDLKSNIFEKYVDKHSYEFLNKSKLYGDEILISNVGDVGSIHLCPILDKPMTLGNNMIMIRSETEIKLEYYIYLLLKSEYGTHLLDGITGGSVQSKFNKTDFRSLKIIIPDNKTLKKFNNIITPIFNQIKQNTKEVENITKLRDTLLPKLMSGEIDVSEINFDL